MSEHFVEGWTAPIDYQLKKNDLPFDGSGMTVSLELRDKAGVVVAEAGTTGWLNAAQSTVRYAPAATDLTFARSPMKARFKVVNGTEVVFFPRGLEAEEWIIGRP
jgi:hypothetical protein